MAELVTLVEQHSVRGLPTVAIKATDWWETVLALVKLQEVGQGVHLHVKVTMYCCLNLCIHIILYSCVQNTKILLWKYCLTPHAYITA